jgi:hypothetical protein
MALYPRGTVEMGEPTSELLGARVVKPQHVRVSTGTKCILDY